MTTVADPPPEPDGDEPNEDERRPALLDRPQPMGVLPSWWFWNDPKNWALIKVPFTVYVVVVMVVVDVIDLPLSTALVVYIAAYWLALGLIERYVRWAAKRRFRSKREPPALLEGREDDQARDD